MAHEKRLLIDVFQAYFYRKNKDGNRELVFMSENLTSGSISSSQENTDVRNGQGNTLFAILPGNKDVTVNLTENVFSFEALKVNSAGKEEAGVQNGVTGNSGLIVKRAGRISDQELEDNQTAGGQVQQAGLSRFKLPQVPQKAGDVVVSIGGVELTRVDSLDLGNEIVDGTFAVVTEDDNKIYDGTNANNKAIYILMTKANADKLRATADLKILPYVYVTDGTRVKTLTIDSKTFAEGGELWLQTIEKDEKQKAIAYVYFVFENAMPEGNFEISTVSEVQPNDMTVNMRILANEDGELYRIVREEIVQ